VLNENEMHVHEHADHGDEHDGEWMHVILVNPKTHELFYSNLADDETQWFTVMHLDLNHTGRTN
jgi:hypothetical protein